MKIKKLLQIIILLFIVIISSCKKDNVKSVSPEVVLSDPATSATGVPLNSKISATFTNLMDPSTITTSQFTLYQGTTNVVGTVECIGTTAAFTPASNLEPNTIYTATISIGAKDTSGKNIEKEFSWTFTTGAFQDVISPTVTLTDPLTSVTGVALNYPVVVTFSEAMDPTTINSSTFTLKQGTTVVLGQLTYIGTRATFTPTSKLEAHKVYTGTISTGAKDLAGNALNSNYTFSFTTGDATEVLLPSVTLTDPVNNATGVAYTKAVTVTFSEAMDPSTINGTTFSLKEGLIAVPGVVTYTGTKATFTSTTNLIANKVYIGTITTGAKNPTGIALISNYTFSFTTAVAPDITAPIINSTDPLNNAIGVVRNKAVALTFSEAMDPGSISALTFTLKQGTNAVNGVVSYSGTTATFTPTNTLAAGTIYTATITTGAKDLAGNALSANTVWSFTTVNAASTLAVVNLGLAGDYVILAKTAISNIAISAVTGDLGLSPAATSYVTGFALTNATGYATASQITGKIFAADMAPPTPINLTTAVTNMMTAYTDAAGRPTPDFSELGTGNIGGKTLTEGLYKWTTSVTMPSDVTISGSATDVWIFQISGNLSMSSAVRITLTGGAQAKNIFWQVAGQATLGTTSHFEGIILSQTGITFQTGASINGRALAQTAVVLDKNTVVKP